MATTPLTMEDQPEEETMDDRFVLVTKEEVEKLKHACSMDQEESKAALSQLKADMERRYGQTAYAVNLEELLRTMMDIFSINPHQLRVLNKIKNVQGALESLKGMQQQTGQERNKQLSDFIANAERITQQAVSDAKAEKRAFLAMYKALREKYFELKPNIARMVSIATKREDLKEAVIDMITTFEEEATAFIDMGNDLVEGCHKQERVTHGFETSLDAIRDVYKQLLELEDETCDERHMSKRMKPSSSKDIDDDDVVFVGEQTADEVRKSTQEKSKQAAADTPKRGWFDERKLVAPSQEVFTSVPQILKELRNDKGMIPLAPAIVPLTTEEVNQIQHDTLNWFCESVPITEYDRLEQLKCRFHYIKILCEESKPDMLSEKYLAGLRNAYSLYKDKMKVMTLDMPAGFFETERTGFSDETRAEFWPEHFRRIRTYSLKPLRHLYRELERCLSHVTHDVYAIEITNRTLKNEELRNAWMKYYDTQKDLRERLNEKRKAGSDPMQFMRRVCTLTPQWEEVLRIYTALLNPP